MKKTVVYVGKEDIAGRKYGREERGFYIKQTGQFLSPHKAIFPRTTNPTDQEIRDKRKELTKMVQDIEEEQQAKAKKACAILADVGISAFGAVKEGQEIVGNFTLKQVLNSDTKSLADKARAFSESLNEVREQVIDKGLVDIGAGMVANEAAIEARKKDLAGSRENNSKQTKAEAILSLQLPQVVQEDCELADEEFDRHLKENFGVDINSKKASQLRAETSNTHWKLKKMYSTLRDVANNDLAGKSVELAVDGVGDLAAIWSQAVIDVRQREKYDDYADVKGEMTREEWREDFKKEVLLEVEYKRRAAKIMDLLTLVGGILVAVPETITSIVGVTMLVSAAHVSSAAAEMILERETDGLSKREMIEIIRKNIIKIIDIEEIWGENNLFVRFKPRKGEQEKTLLQEMEVNSPGMIEGFKSFVQQDLFKTLCIQAENTLFVDTKRFDAGTYGDLLKKDVIIHTEFKSIEYYYGELPAIVEFLKEEGRDYPHVSFLDSEKIKASKVMEEIIKETFSYKKVDYNTTSKQRKKYSFTDKLSKIEGADVPRLIHELHPDEEDAYPTQLLVPAYEGMKKIRDQADPKPYLQQLGKEFAAQDKESYLKKLLRDGIEVGYVNDVPSGYQSDDRNLDYCYVYSTEILNNWAAKHGLKLGNQEFRKDDNLTYDQVFSTISSEFIKADGLVGSVFADTETKYDYIIFIKPQFSYYALETLEGQQFFAANSDVLYGSRGAGKVKEESGKFEFWTGINSGTTYKQTKEKPGLGRGSKIIINGEEIGKNLKCCWKQQNTIDSLFNPQRYEERFEKKGGRVLVVRYVYKPTDILWKKPKLKIKYKYIKDGSGKRCQGDWNELIIKRFKDLDYGIDLPDKGDSLPGSRSENEVKEEADLEIITLVDSEEKGKGKLKFNGNLVTTQELEKKEVQESEYAVYKIKAGDTLRELAREFMWAENLWWTIKKKTGESYTEEEAENLQVGEEVLIPKEKLVSY